MKDKNNNLETYVAEACVFQGKKYRISILDVNLVRLEYSETGEFTDKKTTQIINRNFTKPEFTHNSENGVLTIKTSLFKLDYKIDEPFIASKILFNKNLIITNLINDKRWHFDNPEVRNLFGGTFSLDDYKNKNQMLKDSVKGLFSLDGFASLDDSHSSLLGENNILIKRRNNDIDIYLFIYGEDFKNVLKNYYYLTGQSAMLPRSYLGLFWHKNQAYPEQDIYKLVDNFEKYQIPVSNIILNKDWQEDNNHILNTSLYANMRNLVEHLQKKQINLGLSINPSKENYETNDAYNLQNFYLNKIKKLQELGINLFLNDDLNVDSLIQFNSIFFNSGLEKNYRSMLFSRNHMSAMHKNAINYTGKTIVGWDTLKMLPFYNNISATRGLNLISHDIGGFYGGMEEDELFIRYVQLGVFMPIIRLSSEWGKYYRRSPWKWDIKTYQVTKDYFNLRYALIPYIYSELFHSIKDGNTLIRPLYTSNTDLWYNHNYQNEYMFGSSILVSPIISRKDVLMNRVVHRFYLPEGVWYHFKTGKVYKGNKKHLAFFKDDEYPIFCKAGAIIPLSANVGYNNTNNPKTLELIIFSGQNNSYQLYEDDGLTYNYGKWMFNLTDIDYTYIANNFSLTINNSYTYPNVSLPKRNYRIRFKNIIDVTDLEVSVDGKKVYPVFHIEDNDLIILLDDILEKQKISITGKGNEVNVVLPVDEEIDNIIQDIPIMTVLKNELNTIIFSNDTYNHKRINIRKLERKGLSQNFITMFLKLLEIREKI